MNLLSVSVLIFHDSKNRQHSELVTTLTDALNHHRDVAVIRCTTRESLIQELRLHNPQILFILSADDGNIIMRAHELQPTMRLYQFQSNNGGIFMSYDTQQTFDTTEIIQEVGNYLGTFARLNHELRVLIGENLESTDENQTCCVVVTAGMILVVIMGCQIYYLKQQCVHTTVYEPVRELLTTQKHCSGPGEAHIPRSPLQDAFVAVEVHFEVHATGGLHGLKTLFCDHVESSWDEYCTNLENTVDGSHTKFLYTRATKNYEVSVEGFDWTGIGLCKNPGVKMSKNMDMTIPGCEDFMTSSIQCSYEQCPALTSVVLQSLGSVATYMMFIVAIVYQLLKYFKRWKVAASMEATDDPDPEVAKKVAAIDDTEDGRQQLLDEAERDTK